MAKKLHFEDLLLHEDDDFMVINKPSGISTLEDRNAYTNILDLARAYCEGAQVGHRLDKETTGALVLSKHAEAYRHISQQFEHRKTTKIYHAVVDGPHDFDNEVVNAPLHTMGNGKVKVHFYDGKPAETIINTLKAYRLHTWVACQPITGRMHQIRVHLAHKNAPIASDGDYGGKPFYLSAIKKRYNLKKGTEELPLIKRVALHAYSIGFEGMKGDKLVIEAPHPKDFAVLLTQLDKNS